MTTAEEILKRAEAIMLKHSVNLPSAIALLHLEHHMLPPWLRVKRWFTGIV